jgi:hypothetical protein
LFAQDEPKFCSGDAKIRSSYAKLNESGVNNNTRILVLLSLSTFCILRCTKGANNSKKVENFMWKAALAGAIAFVAIGPLSISQHGVVTSSAAAQDVVIREGDIARLKSALKLSSEQEVHWRPVEVALHAYARQQYRLASADGYFGDGDFGMSAYTLSAVMLQKVKMAAQPLIKTLSEEQKQAGTQVLQSMGVSF